jgi:hypothetical protein
MASSHPLRPEAFALDRRRLVVNWCLHTLLKVASPTLRELKLREPSRPSQPPWWAEPSQFVGNLRGEPNPRAVGNARPPWRAEPPWHHRTFMAIATSAAIWEPSQASSTPNFVCNLRTPSCEIRSALHAALRRSLAAFSACTPHAAQNKDRRLPLTRSAFLIGSSKLRLHFSFVFLPQHG